MLRHIVVPWWITWTVSGQECRSLYWTIMDIGMIMILTPCWILMMSFNRWNTFMKGPNFNLHTTEKDTEPWESASHRCKYIQTPLIRTLEGTMDSVPISGCSLLTGLNGPLPSSKNPHFQNEAFLWKWVMISLSKAEHLPSFWNRGPGTRKWPIFVERIYGLFPGTKKNCRVITGYPY